MNKQKKLITFDFTQKKGNIEKSNYFCLFPQ